jgi:uncharacterized protein (DUF58 family)
MIPRRALLVLTVLLVLGSVAVTVLPAHSEVWLSAALAMLVVVAGDAAAGARTPAPHIERHIPGSMSLVSWVNIGLAVSNSSTRRAVRLQLFDHHPDSFSVRRLPIDLRIAAARVADVAYRARPMQRGEVMFAGCDVRIASPLGFWWRRRFVEVSSRVRVYPNYSTISKLLAYEVDNRLQLAGLRLRRRRGEGIEFHQLRDYREGDGLRSVDWKATSVQS